MPSPHSPVSDKSSVRREQVIQLLQDGAVTIDPNEDCLAVATDMQRLGLIEASTSTFVWCANPHDADYSESNHYCRGRIYIPENMEESFEDFYCPECDRPVFPDVDEKQQHRELRCEIVPGGVISYIKSLLDAVGLKATSVCDSVMRIDVGPLGVFACVADTCQEQRFMTRQWAAAQPTCYILIDPRTATSRFLQEDWLHRVRLVDLVCGKIDLREALQKAADSPLPVSLKNVDVPVFSRGPMPRLISSPQTPPTHRQFVIQLASKSVWVDRVQVVAVQAGPRFEIIRILWDQYIEDLRANLFPQDFHACPLRALVQTLEMRLGSSYPDETVVRRNVNRLQVDIEMAIKRKLGSPIDREDIIETCNWSRQDADDFGYRLNPACVVIGPSRSDQPD